MLQCLTCIKYVSHVYKQCRPLQIFFRNVSVSLHVAVEMNNFMINKNVVLYLNETRNLIDKYALISMNLYCYLGKRCIHYVRQLLTSLLYSRWKVTSTLM